MDVLSSKLQLADAKIKLAKATEPVASDNEELARVAIQKVQKQAMLEKIESLLKDYYNARESVESLKRLDTQLEYEFDRKATVERIVDQLSLDAEPTDGDVD